MKSPFRCKSTILKWKVFNWVPIRLPQIIYNNTRWLFLANVWPKNQKVSSNIVSHFLIWLPLTYFFLLYSNFYSDLFIFKYPKFYFDQLLKQLPIMRFEMFWSLIHLWRKCIIMWGPYFKSDRVWSLIHNAQNDPQQILWETTKKRYFWCTDGQKFWLLQISGEVSRFCNF